jgi:hypothetical protein
MEEELDEYGDPIKHRPVARAHNGSMACPRCGGPTFSCVKADDVCEDDACGYVGYVYSGTIYG